MYDREVKEVRVLCTAARFRKSQEVRQSSIFTHTSCIPSVTRVQLSSSLCRLVSLFYVYTNNAQRLRSIFYKKASRLISRVLTGYLVLLAVSKNATL